MHIIYCLSIESRYLLELQESELETSRPRLAKLTKTEYTRRYSSILSTLHKAGIGVYRQTLIKTLFYIQHNILCFSSLAELNGYIRYK